MYTPSPLSLARNNGNALYAAFYDLGAVQATQILAEEKGGDPTVFDEKIGKIQTFITELTSAKL